jgi:hypothetical protein
MVHLLYSAIEKIGTVRTNVGRTREVMKLFITLPYDPDGIEETDGWDRDPVDRDWFVQIGIVGWTGRRLIEGDTVHFTRDAAVKKAREYRAAWIAQSTAEAARIAALPAIAD